MDEQATFRVHEPDPSCLIVAGEVDLAVAEPFRAATKELLDRAGGAATIDLTRVTFFNSTGIGVLCDVADAARERATRLRLLVSPTVRRTLELAGLVPHFDLG